LRTFCAAFNPLGGGNSGCVNFGVAGLRNKFQQTRQTMRLAAALPAAMYAQWGPDRPDDRRLPARPPDAEDALVPLALRAPGRLAPSSDCNPATRKRCSHSLQTITRPAYFSSTRWTVSHSGQIARKGMGRTPLAVFVAPPVWPSEDSISRCPRWMNTVQREARSGASETGCGLMTRN
jgi:hypothetical protein